METVSEKKRLVTLLLALFLGVLGVHRFYVGKVGTGVVMLLLTLTGYGLFVTSIWALVDVIMIALGTFTDKNGAKVDTW